MRKNDKLTARKLFLKLLFHVKRIYLTKQTLFQLFYFSIFVLNLKHFDFKKMSYCFIIFVNKKLFSADGYFIFSLS